MKPLRLLTAIALISSTLVILPGCGKKPVIGVLLASSGAASVYGESMKNGIELAMSEAEANGTVPVGLSVVWADSGTDPERAANEFCRLATDHGAQIVIAGTTSGEAKALLPVLDETDTICLSPSATLPALTKDSKLFYRVFSSDELEGRRAGRFLREDKGSETVLIFSEDSEQARGIEPPFRHAFEQALQGKVVGRVVVNDPEWQKDATDLLTVHGPKSVYVIGYAENTLAVLRLLREKGFDGNICVTSAFYGGDVIEDNKELVDGIYFPQPAFDVQDERELVQSFVKAYRDRFGSDPDIYAAHAYDALRVVHHVISSVEVYETSELRKALQFGIKEFPGVTGIIQFNDYGDVHHNPIIFIIKDGQVLMYEKYLKEEKKKILARIRATMSG